MRDFAASVPATRGLIAAPWTPPSLKLCCRGTTRVMASPRTRHVIVRRSRCSGGTGVDQRPRCLAVGFPPLAGQVQLAVALGEDVTIAAEELVVRRDIADGAVQADGVV